jgi:hypothetical protein
MRGRKGRLAKLLSVPVLAVCGFALAATMAGVGLATTTSSTTTTTPPTTVPTTTTTTTTPTTTTEPPGNEGCTPGFWKNHPEDWDVYVPEQLVGSVFSAAPASVANLTLLQGLQNGGGQEQALTRHAIAALLAAANDEVEYPLTVQQVIDMVNAAFASGDFEPTKDLLDEFNNAGAPGFCD